MSTLWYAQRVESVVSVEHDPDWLRSVVNQAPENCSVLLRTDAVEYVRAIREFDPFDLVVIDGLHRSESVSEGLSRLDPRGVLIWDNSDWPEFIDSYARLENLGFRRLEFRGLGPISRQSWETSILYRPENCLGI